ncbi:hypothetical protein HK101_011126 [Irineochytrium annulatum]|nr:hypothetical protein HK101_011126 [Irineochytrium annulatum]
MGKSGRIAFCNCLFWTKTLIAFLLSTGGLAYLAYKVYDLNQYAKTHPQPQEVTVINDGQGNQPIQPGAPAVVAGQPVAPGTTTAVSCNAGQAQFAGRTLARVEPPTNKIMLGFSINWQLDTPAQVTQRLGGLKPAVVNAFFQVNAPSTPGNVNSTYDYNTINWFGSLVGKNGGILELTMEPTTTMAELKDDVMDAVAQQCLRINKEYGVPILLRFGHEMNGQWTEYGMQPTGYKEGFRRMTGFIRKYTNLTAMVWGPNIGIAYPFNPKSEWPKVLSDTNSPDFLALDTNGNKVLDQDDDPYSPYYPGDEYVDWVALSLYYYPLLGQNEAIQPTYFKDSMTGQGAVVEATAQPPLSATYIKTRQFYQNFAAAKGKPMMLPETGAPWYTNMDGSPLTAAGQSTPLAIKQGWWEQVFSQDTLTNFPLLKLVVNFEEAKPVPPNMKDWTVTNPFGNDTSGVAQAFNQKMQSFGPNMLFGGQSMQFGCDGSVALTGKN